MLTEVTDARTLHGDAVVVDCHNDLPLMLLEWQRSLGAAGVRDYLRTVWVDEFRAGGVDVQVVPVYLDPEIAEAGLRRTLLAIELLREEIAKAPDDLALCTSGAAIDAAVAGGKVAILIALEGIQSLGTDVEL